ncbi:nucleotide sugar dehydrogenase [Desertimonas flava]|uniref:nucleotide sugar dehydrogenase n=1 Tax=Desertimonas flava TaxID=2064846 RepID=UPI000E348A36|nr:nucleotide sugar dehydrogenase [Desertimonas flava]
MSPPRRVVILGQGYVGLPFAMRAAEVGFEVVGFDVDAERVALLAQGESFIEDVPHDELKRHLHSGKYRPSADVTDLAEFDVAVISVPTPLRDGLPDIAYIERATEMIGPYVRPGCCVILESTTYPGTTVDVVAPRLAELSGLEPGADFAVGYSPERIDPGNPRWTFRNTPKIVSGIDAASLDVVDEFYSAVVDTTVRVKGTKEAELAKLLENTFRHVNIALVNELAVSAHDLGIDVWDVIDAAASKPFGFMKFTPGPGVGGHCLPVDPSYLSWQVRRTLGRAFRFVELANDINEHMPDYVVQRVTDRFNRQGRAVNGSRVVAIGVTYKKNTSDARESPALVVISRLTALGATVVVADPLVDRRHLPAGVDPVELTTEQLGAADLVLVLTDHDDIDWDAVAAVDHKVFDTRRRLAYTDAEVI